MFCSLGVPCLIPALRNVRLPKDFKGPRKVPNYTANLQPEAWVESYEMAMEMLVKEICPRGNNKVIIYFLIS